MVSTSFANERYRNQQRKAIAKAEQLSESYHLPIGAAPPYLCLLRRNFCAAGGVLFGYSGAIFERSKSPFLLTTAAQNIHVFLRKIAAMQKVTFFEWLKNSKFPQPPAERVTLKKSATAGAYAPHVHLRLRKRLARCTLDCGFKTSESPALRGFVAERCPITGTSLYLVLKSNGLRRSKKIFL